MLWSAAVASSWHTITRLRSPARQTTVSSGFATLAPIAAGRPKPIVPRPPGVIQRRGFREGVEFTPPNLGWAAAGGGEAAPPPALVHPPPTPPRLLSPPPPPPRVPPRSPPP